MTEEIDAIMFDAGGTLIDLQPSRDEFIARAISRNGHRVRLDDVARATVLADRKFDHDFALIQGRNEDSFWRKYDEFLLKELDLKIDLDKFVTDLEDVFGKSTSVVSSWHDYPDVKPVLEQLEKRDFKLGVLSNATELLRRVLDSLDLSRHFDFVVISDEVGSRKPSPEIFRAACRTARVSPGRVFYVGDKYEIDVVGASKAGMNAVLLDRRNVYPKARCVRIRDLHFFAKFL